MGELATLATMLYAVFITRSASVMASSIGSTVTLSVRPVVMYCDGRSDYISWILSTPASHSFMPRAGSTSTCPAVSLIGRPFAVGPGLNLSEYSCLATSLVPVSLSVSVLAAVRSSCMSTADASELEHATVV